MAQVDVVHWNPVRPVVGTPWNRIIRTRRAVGNFGDLLGPVIVEAMLRRAGIIPADGPTDARLLSVGSIIQLGRTGDTVWGSGVNGKTADWEYTFDDLDVRAVRGPLTRDFLADRGIDSPPVFGDPALLLPELHPNLREWSSRKRHAVTVVPNLRDSRAMLRGSGRGIRPTAPVDAVLRRIAESELVVGSSLHGIIVAESLGIPARLVRSDHESPFKYEDYYRGTGRQAFAAASTVREAIAAGGEPPIEWDAAPLIAAFPIDLWTGPRPDGPVAARTVKVAA